MKKVSLCALIACALILLLRISGLITYIQYITSDYYQVPTWENSFLLSTSYQIFSGIVGIICWILIGSFFFVLYKKQPK